MFWTLFNLFLALLRSIDFYGKWVARFLSESIYLSIVEGSANIPTLAVIINDFITNQSTLGREFWELIRIYFAPSINNRANCGSIIWRWTISLIDNLSDTVSMALPKIIDFRNNVLTFAWCTSEELLLICSLVVHKIFHVSQLVPLKHRSFAGFKCSTKWIDLINEAIIIDVGGVNVRT